MHDTIERRCHSIETTALSRLTMRELLAVQEGVRTVAEALSGIICQPRFRSEKTLKLTPGGELLSGLLDHLHNLRQTAFDIAEGATVKSSADAESKAWLMLQCLSDYRDSLPDVAALAAEMVAEVYREQNREDIGRAAA